MLEIVPAPPHSGHGNLGACELGLADAIESYKEGNAVAELNSVQNCTPL
jgi:hypothetical protein